MLLDRDTVAGSSGTLASLKLYQKITTMMTKKKKKGKKKHFEKKGEVRQEIQQCSQAHNAERERKKKKKTLTKLARSWLLKASVIIPGCSIMNPSQILKT